MLRRRTVNYFLSKSKWRIYLQFKVCWMREAYFRGSTININNHRISCTRLCCQPAAVATARYLRSPLQVCDEMAHGCAVYVCTFSFLRNLMMTMMMEQWVIKTLPSGYMCIPTTFGWLKSLFLIWSSLSLLFVFGFWHEYRWRIWLLHRQISRETFTDRCSGKMLLSLARSRISSDSYICLALFVAL